MASSACCLVDQYTKNKCQIQIRLDNKRLVVNTEINMSAKDQDTSSSLHKESDHKSRSFKKIFGKKIIVIILLPLVSSVIGLASLNSNKYKPNLYQSSGARNLENFALTLLEPSDRQVFTNSLASIVGKTLPNTTVIVYSENDSTSVESDSSGQFKTQVLLSTGLNRVNIVAFNNNGLEKTVALDVVYDSSIKGEKTSKNEEESSPPGQEKDSQQPPAQQPQDQAPGQEKKETTTQAATIGDVQHVTEDSVVIEEKKQGKEVEAKVNESTQIINQNDKTLKLQTIKPKDQAAIIPEVPTSASSQEADRIFIKQATSSAQTKRQALQGVIKEISGYILKIHHQIQTQREYTVIMTNDTEVKIKGIASPTLSDLKVGYSVAVVGDLNDQGLITAKWIHVIPGRSKITGIPEPSAVLSPNLTPTVTASITPTLIIQPTSTPTLTATSIPTPTPVACRLLSAVWNTSTTSVEEGANVDLLVTTSDNCIGEQLYFEIREDDGILGFDSVNINPSPVIISSNIIETSWTAEYQPDGLLGASDPPEYYFVAALTGDQSIINSSDPKLEVTQSLVAIPTPTATPTPSETSYPYGSCVIRDENTNLPNYYDSDSAPGYVKHNLTSGGTFDQIRAACTQEIYEDLMSKYCLSNSKPGQWQIAGYNSEGNYFPGGITGCGIDAFTGCEYRLCPSASPSLTPTITTSITPTPTTEPTIPASSTTTPIPTPTPEPCRLLSATWKSSETRVSEGTNVMLSVNSSDNCAGEQLFFDIREDDGLVGYDTVNTNPTAQVISSNVTEVSWTAEYQSDGLLGVSDPPEYYFIASLADGAVFVVSSDPKLEVTKIISEVPAPTSTPKPTTTSAVLEYPFGACVVRNENTNLPSYYDTDIAPGYVKRNLTSGGTYQAILASCTEEIYQDLMNQYCASNSLNAQWQVAGYDALGNYAITGCGLFGCTFRPCPSP